MEPDLSFMNKHMIDYENLLETTPNPLDIRFTSHDDAIYSLFREILPEFNVKSIPAPSTSLRLQWIRFMARYVSMTDGEEHMLGTALRKDVTKPFTTSNAVIVFRVVFYAIELARHRENVRMIARIVQRRRRKVDGRSRLGGVAGLRRVRA
jgi:hypothetical protein